MAFFCFFLLAADEPTGSFPGSSSSVNKRLLVCVCVHILIPFTFIKSFYGKWIVSQQTKTWAYFNCERYVCIKHKSEVFFVVGSQSITRGIVLLFFLSLSSFHKRGPKFFLFLYFYFTVEWASRYILRSCASYQTPTLDTKRTESPCQCETKVSTDWMCCVCLMASISHSL